MTAQSGHDERRDFHRVHFDADVHIQGAGQEYRGRLIDISMKGVLLEQPKEWRALEGEHLTLEIPLGADGEHIDMRVEVAHQEGGRVGCRWLDIDVESFGHLRRLLELNLGDPDLVNRELSALGKHYE